ncbi:flagellin [Clostridia bacterium]|nr:flagellin [Clostridia bacterium]GHV34031.1 flagellin [Clostridia bacterium]
MRIQNNIMAMNTHRQLAINQSNNSKSTEKLSSGYRINRAADDAAGLSISEKMRAQIRGLNRASANAQDGVSMIQAAEGALQESHSILQRIRELAVQGANDVNAEEDRVAIKNEIDQLGVELDRIAVTTNFNGKYVLSGQYQFDGNGATLEENISEEIDPDGNGYLGALNIQAGANATASDVIQIAFRGVTATDLLGEQGVTDTTWYSVASLDDYADRINPGAADDTKGFLAETGSNDELFGNLALGVGADSETGENFTSGFQALINVIDGRMIDGSKNEDGPKTGIALISDLRSQLGAVQNRLEHTIANLDTVAENMQAAESRIRDVDMAKEMMAFTTSNVLNQAATAMLAQANQAPQTVLSLLRS